MRQKSCGEPSLQRRRQMRIREGVIKRRAKFNSLKISPLFRRSRPFVTATKMSICRAPLGIYEHQNYILISSTQMLVVYHRAPLHGHPHDWGTWRMQEPKMRDSTMLAMSHFVHHPGFPYFATIISRIQFKSHEFGILWKNAIGETDDAIQHSTVAWRRLSNNS